MKSSEIQNRNCIVSMKRNEIASNEMEWNDRAGNGIKLGSMEQNGLQKDRMKSTEMHGHQSE
jgi:hypothetical protein